MKPLKDFISRIRYANSWLLLTWLFVVPFVGKSSFSQAQGTLKDIALKDVISSKEVKFSNFSSKQALVILFFCNDCPYSVFYTERIKDLIAKYSQNQFLLVNSSNSNFVPEESEENMARFARDNNLAIPYLADKQMTAKKLFNATKCPEVFVVDPKEWEVVYQGAIDDNPQVATDVDQSFLKEVLDQIQNGQPVSISRQRPTGCIIK